MLIVFLINFPHLANLLVRSARVRGVVWADYSLLRFILTSFGVQTSGQANTGLRFRV